MPVFHNIKIALATCALTVSICLPAYGATPARKTKIIPAPAPQLNPYKQDALKILRSLSNVCDNNNTVLIYTGFLNKARQERDYGFQYHEASSIEIFNLTEFHFFSYDVKNFDQVYQLNNGIKSKVSVVLSPYSNFEKKRVANRNAIASGNYKDLAKNETKYKPVEYHRFYGSNGTSPYMSGDSHISFRVEFIIPVGSKKIITNLFGNSAYYSSNDPSSPLYSSRLAQVISTEKLEDIVRPSCDEMRNNPSAFQGIYAPDVKPDDRFFESKEFTE